jgi:hypothetical protein
VLADRERRRPHRDAGMQHGAHMGVVGVEARAERHVEKRRMLRVEALGREQDVRGTGAPDHPDIAARPAAPRQTRADRADAQVVEQQPPELLPHLGRQRRGIEIGREGGERSGRLGSVHVGSGHFAILNRSASLPYFA